MDLQENGKNPFEITKYDITSHAADIKDHYDEMDGKQVYLLRTEDRNGEEAIYEINQNAIHDTLTIEGVYDEIKTDHVYQFRVAPKDTYDGHYPAVCGAVSRIDGFTEETSAQDQK